MKPERQRFVIGMTSVVAVLVISFMIVVAAQRDRIIKPIIPVPGGQHHMAEPIILPWGRIEFGNNEISIISTVQDPPGVRLAGQPGGAFGKVSFSRMRHDGVQEEVALLIGTNDDRHPNSLVGSVSLHVRGPAIGDDDDAFKRVATFNHDGVEFHVPVRYPNQGHALRRIALRSVANGKIVCAENGGSEPLIANRDSAQSWETFEVIELP